MGFEHSERLFKAYAGDKKLVSFEGGHNSPRPTFFNTSVMIFFHNVLKIGTAGTAHPSPPGGAPDLSPRTAASADDLLIQEAIALSLSST